jgi:hypothetical protein
VVTYSGNDIEAWSDSPCETCGIGAEAWYAGYSSSTSIINADYGNEVYDAQNPTGELFDMGGMNPGDAKQYMTAWGCPRNLGSITITGITGKNGVVSFTSTAGVSGTLDMATGTWTFSP